MISPRPRLVYWFAGVAVPFSAAAGLWPPLVVPCLGILAGFGALVALDAAIGIRRPRRLAAACPDVVRFSKDRDGEVPVTLSVVSATGGGTPPVRTVRVGLSLPDSFDMPEEGVLVNLPADGSRWQVGVPCRPTRRGAYPLGACVLEVSSPLGLWASRRRLPVSGELRVYPNLLPERRRLAALFLNRGGMGIHARRQVGQGREFERLREYLPGDSFEDIHWKASAKRARPITKLYQVERTQEVYVIVDASRLSARTVPVERGSGAQEPVNVLEYYLRAALVLGLVAERQGDLFGVATFSDQVHRFVRARNGRAHFDACREALFQLHPRIVNPDFDELCAFVRTRLRRRALLFFLTSLDDPVLSESFARNMEMIGSQHVIVAAMFRPAGARPLFSDPAVSNLSAVYDALAGHLILEDLRELELVLRRRGVHFSLLERETLCPDLVTRYLSIKQRQLL